jgi:hypothetical protein
MPRPLPVPIELSCQIEREVSGSGEEAKDHGHGRVQRRRFPPRPANTTTPSNRVVGEAAVAAGKLRSVLSIGMHPPSTSGSRLWPDSFPRISPWLAQIRMGLTEITTVSVAKLDASKLRLHSGGLVGVCFRPRGK